MVASTPCNNRDFVIVADENPAEKQIFNNVLGEKYNILEVTPDFSAQQMLEKYGEKIACAIFSESYGLNRTYVYIQKFLSHVHRNFVNRIPVILLTERYTVDDCCDMMKIGITDIIVRPINEYVAQTRLNNYLELFNYRNRVSKLIESAWKYSSSTRTDIDEDIMNQISDLWQSERSKYERLSETYSEDIVATYYFNTDVLALSKVFEELFSDGNEVTDAVNFVKTTDIVNEDDKKTIFKRIKALKPADSTFNMPVRMRKNGSDSYEWYLLNAYAFWSNSGSLSSLLMKFVNINEQMTDLNRWKQCAQTDDLTGLQNRNAFYQDVVHSLKKNEKTGAKFAVFMLDIDNFKSINDTNGHLWGDKVISAVGNTIKASFRENDMVARIGGDEFAAIMRNVSSLDDVAAKARSICSHIYNLMKELNKEHECFVSVSIGISISQLHGVDYDTLLGKADQALYKAKKAGKNTFRIYEE